VYIKARTVVKRLRFYHPYSHVSLAGHDTMYLQVCVCVCVCVAQLGPDDTLQCGLADGSKMLADAFQ